MVTKVVHACRSAWVDRSFSREMAAIALVLYAVLTGYYFSIRDPALVTAFAPAYTTITFVVLPIIAAAYGGDKFLKAMEAGRRPAS